MKKNVVLCLVVLIYLNANSQIQILKQAHAPENNDWYGYSSADMPVSVGAADTGVYWNFYTIEQYLTDYVEFKIDTAGAIDSLHQFPNGSDLVNIQKNERVAYLYRTTSDSQGDYLYETGNYDSQYKHFETYSKTLKKLNYPFSYLDEFSDTLVRNFGLSQATIRRHVKADAWGVISLPFIGTRNCIRVVTCDTVVTLGCGGFGCSNPVTEYITTYEWYSEQEKQPAMVYQSIETKGEAIIKYNVRILHNKILAVENVNPKKHFSVYPNPCENELYFESFTGKIVVLDVQGRLYFENNISGKQAVNTEELESGLYLISFYSAEGIYLGCERFCKK